MRRLIRYTTLLALIFVVGCTKFAQSDVEMVSSAPQTLYAEIEQSDVRIFVEQSKLFWHTDDQISLFPATTANVQYQYKEKNDVGSAIFEKVSSSEVEGQTLELYYSLYPYSAQTTISNQGVITYSLPEVQSYAADSFGADANVMVAVTESASGGHLNFKNVVGYLTINLYGKEVSVKSITLKGNNREKLAGEATITATYGVEPVMELSDNGSESLTLDCGEGVAIGEDAESATSFWFVVPTVTFANGFTVEVTDTYGDTYTQTTNNIVEIARNTIQPMAAFEIVPPLRAGSDMPLWSEGHLDIHFINSGRGECCFYILPDGTTLLVDAGEVVATYKPNSIDGDAAVEQKPNASTRPYMVYANYIKHFIPENRTSINWCLASHFHIDHIGSASAATETHPEAGYRKSGLLALFDEIPFYRVVDRAFPDYVEDDNTPVMDGQLSEDWVKFVKYQIAQGKIGKGYRFTPGEEQIVLCYDRKKEKYSNFTLLNICANGFVYRKSQKGVAAVYGSKSEKGNPASCGFHISYGKFDYMACGDLTSTPQNHMADYYNDFIGPGHLDAFKTNHHLSSNSWGSGMQDESFDAQVVANQNFYKKQPDPTLLTKILDNSWCQDFFTTNLHPKWKSENSTLYNRVAGSEGHIVIRVSPGGDTFYVYLLDDTNFEYKIKAIYGPYESV